MNMPTGIRPSKAARAGGGGGVGRGRLDFKRFRAKNQGAGVAKSKDQNSGGAQAGCVVLLATEMLSPSNHYRSPQP